MRMRKKKHLESRTENCGEYLMSFTTEDKNFNTAVLNKDYIDFKELFGNDNPVYLEIGCGKGQFACEMAKLHPNWNFLAVEKVQNVIVAAAEKARNDELPNVRFVKCGAEYLPCFIPDKSIAGIYLNFSCPYPKNAYKSHRLTNERFLKIYNELLMDNAIICQKTDNMHFFEYSLEEFSRCGWRVENISLDLHNSDIEENVVTEYEHRFSSQGFPIYRLEAKKPKENILVSQCLLGIKCKYDGGANSLEGREVLEKNYNLIPVCPECLGGLPIPRVPAEIADGRVINKNGEDVTENFERGAESALMLAQTFNCKKAVLKSNSPSCGYGQVYDGTFSHKKKEGNGITADLLERNGIMIYNENQIGGI